MELIKENQIQNKINNKNKKIKFRSFEDTRNYVHSLRLKNKNEWLSWTKSGQKPDDIPSDPRWVYKQNWRCWGDWLGTGTIASFNRKFSSFEEARSYARSLGLKNQDEWRWWIKNGKKTDDIPANPERTYKNEWQNWGDWLGTGFIAPQNREYRSFDDARKFVHTLKIKNQNEWKAWVKSGLKPDDIPANPRGVYKKDWQGTGDWLGNGTIANQNKEYRQFEDARNHVRQQKLHNKNDWISWAKTSNKPHDIPADPAGVYKKYWRGWGDWLGTGFIAPKNREYRSFDDARKFVHTLKIKNQNEWRQWSKLKRPNDIPGAPDKTYQDLWQGWSDFLGTKDLVKYVSFEEAKKFAQSLGVKNRKEWYVKFRSLNIKNIPANPEPVYKKEWNGWEDFLGSQVAYLSFESAQDYIFTLGFRNEKEYRDWANSPKRPNNIPKYPRTAYKNDGWINFPHFLSIKQKNFSDLIQAPSYEDLKFYVHKMNIKGRDDWTVWAKSDQRPENVPASPSVYYANKGWVSWGDFLGTETVATKNKKIKNFFEAREFVRTLRIQSEREWKIWAKTKKRPKDIPADPRRTYKNSGWNGFCDFLGIQRLGQHLSFEEAKLCIQQQKIKTKRDFVAWVKSDSKPKDIPKTPNCVYKNEWRGWGDFLGTETVAPKNKKIKNFFEAREFVRTLRIQSEREWKIWAKTEKRPKDVPPDPRRIYKNSGWNGFCDFLGIQRLRQYLSFEEAKLYIQKQKIKTKEDFFAWAKSDSKPKDIPKTPNFVYKSEWRGWGDWLGQTNSWTKTAILGFLKSIEPILISLKPSELYSIMYHNGLLDSLRGNTKSNDLLKSLRSLCSSNDLQSDFDKIIQKFEPSDLDEEENISNAEINDFDIDDCDKVVHADLSDHDINKELPYIKDIKELSCIDTLVKNLNISDEEIIEFLISNRVCDLWNTVLNYKDKINIAELRNKNKGVYFNTIRDRFIEQYDGSHSIITPDDWSYTQSDQIIKPNLMQKLTSYKVLKEKRVGNWSGTGAGKTISAILTSAVINAKVTVIIAFNSTIDGWESSILNAFPNSNLIKKETTKIEIKENVKNYILLNFEKFQQTYSQEFVLKMVNNLNIDFIVLDEIQSVKQRNDKKISKRREIVKAFIIKASEKNENLSLLGMSATPVINNLFEGKALLEMITGFEFEELDVNPSINNAILLHQKLILHGIRYLPRYNQNISENYPQIDGNEFLEEIKKISKNEILSIEVTLLDIKLPKIKSYLKKGTIIYTHYKTGMVPKIEQSMRNLGYTTGLYTGDEKSGLDDFVDGKIDILVGTAPIGTGVDRLQKVCDRLIILCLPWTSAEYQQLVGRIYRQGSRFSDVEVIIPQVCLDNNGSEWSWDKLRLKRIQYKKTLADAVLDGVIPEGKLESEQMMCDGAYKALQAWIKRVEEDGVFSIERRKLMIPLDGIVTENLIKRFGDFTAMNARINSSNSKTTHERFKEEPSEWYLYHSLYRTARESWSEVPYEKIAQSISQRPDWVVGDFGCGEALLSTLISNKVHSFDHIAINENVISCDLSNVPLENSSLDVVVFSLSLMGLNFEDYLKEAYRTLKFGGLLKIAEPQGRWRDSVSELLQKIRACGFVISGDPIRSDDFIYLNGIKI